MRAVLRHARQPFVPPVPLAPARCLYFQRTFSLRYGFSQAPCDDSAFSSSLESPWSLPPLGCSQPLNLIRRIFMMAGMGDQTPPVEPMEPSEPIRLRSYQQEMLEESLTRNVIVAMDTGSGKTHVAISRIQAELERSSPEKLVWFATPSVALSMQQHAVLSSHLPAYKVRMLTGDSGVDAWTDQSIWNAVLTNVRVVVGTPKVLEDALTHGFVTISRLALLVFDEAHRCIGNSPMNTIMRGFYHPAKALHTPVPHILGLTASPIISTHSSTLKELETDLDAVAVTPKIHRSSLEEYVHQPTLTTISYSPPVDVTFRPTSPFHQALEAAFTSYSFSSDPYVLELLSRDDAKAQQQLLSVQQNSNTYSYTQLKTLRNRANTMSEQLGSSAAEWYIRHCTQTFLNHVPATSFGAHDLNQKERVHLRNIFERIKSVADVQMEVDEAPTVSEKLQSLFAILREQDITSVRGIIFVEQRATVTAMAHMIRTSPDVSKGYSVGSFVGTSSFADRKASISDIVDTKQQQQDLVDFRDGKKNLMVATNVLEEGIDISACNLVICFDPPKNLISFVQRRGRARKSRSDFVVFLSPLDAASHPAKWQELEHKMKQAYMEDRELAPSVPETLENAERTYTIEMTGAKLTLQNAKAHLHHFCAVSSKHGGRYVDVRPEFETKHSPATSRTGSAFDWTARVTLPAFVHPSVRIACSSRGYGSEANAVKDAAFEAYASLHKAELLNDNLLPLTAQHLPELDPQYLDQASIVDVPSPINVWEWATNGNENAAVWHEHELSISLEGITVIGVDLLLPCALFQPLSFDLYWNEITAYRAEILSLDRTRDLKGDERQTLQDLTHTILGAVHNRNLPHEAVKQYAFLLTRDKQGLIQPTQPLEGSYPATALETMINADGIGLIHVKSEPGRSYTFAPDGSAVQKQMSVKRFTQRADFLQPIMPIEAQNDAYTTVFSFPLTECVVDNLPAQYALLSAFLPSIMHRVQGAACAQLLKQEILPEVRFSDHALLEEATTSPACGGVFDYNRLEYLGDTILKFYTVRQVMSQRPTWPEEYLSLRKFLLVSNRTLAETAQRLSLSRFVHLKRFTGRKWQPDQLGKAVEQSQQISSKVLADVVEALIGAGFVEGGLEKSFEVLQTLLPEEHWYSHEEPMSRLLQQTPAIECAGLESLQRLIGHAFQNPGLLVEAITHASFPNNTTTLSYERLEFLGDAVLDMILVPRLFKHPRKLKESEMESYKKCLASGRFLSYICMSFSMDETSYDVTMLTSANGTQAHLSPQPRQIRLCDFLRCGEQTATLKRATIESFQHLHPTIHNALYHGLEYPWIELTTLAAPKFLGDMVESLLGAIYLDSRGDLGVCEAFVRRVGILDIADRMVDERVEVAEFKQRLSLLVGSETIDYETVSTIKESGKEMWGCVVKVGGGVVVEVEGCARKDGAELRAAREALVELEGRDEGGRKKRRNIGSEDVEKEAFIGAVAEDNWL